jgi:hypothetical protein
VVEIVEWLRLNGDRLTDIVEGLGTPVSLFRHMASRP